VGDSGSPTFVYNKKSNKTILLLGYAGFGTEYYDNTPDPFFTEEPGYISNLQRLQTELQNNGGYSLNLLNMDDVDLVTINDLVQTDVVVPPLILPAKPYVNNFTNVPTTPLNKYPYSSRILRK
jgi:hypothetical protein